MQCQIVRPSNNRNFSLFTGTFKINWLQGIKMGADFE